MRKVILGCVVLAALSLLLPARGLHFDSWAWVLWGRQTALFELDTLGGPSWKPFPVFFTTLFAPFSKIDGGIPPMLWLVVARAGGILSVVMAYRLAARLAGPEQWIKIVAGVAATATLIITPRWVMLTAHGYTEPLAAALLFWGIERHLDGRRDHAFILGFLVALNRPEFWPFLGAYAVFLWLREPERRKLVAGMLALLPVLWLVPEWIGAGDPFSAGKQARSEPPWSLSHAAHPWFAALERASSLMLHPLKLAAVFATGWALYKRDWRVAALGFAVGGWMLLVAVMTQGGFSGNPRYFLLAVGIAALLAGIGIARLIALAPTNAGRAAIAVLLALLVAPFAAQRAPLMNEELSFVKGNAEMHRQLDDAIDAAGGPAKIASLGAPYANRGFIVHLAWDLKLPIRDIQKKGAQRKIVFTARRRHSGRPVRLAPGSKIEVVAHSGAWRVLKVTAPTSAPATAATGATP